MKPYQQRVIEEKSQLDERLKKLEQFFNTEIYSKATPLESSLLHGQHRSMMDYSHYLGERIKLFT